MVEYSKYVKTKNDIKNCVDIPYFYGASIKYFTYLIDEYKFEKAETKLIGRECQIYFKNKDKIFKITYEMGSLPEFYVFSNNKFINLSEVSNEYENLFNTKNYIKTISSYWNDNKKEIIEEIKIYIYNISVFIKNNINLFL